jgi:hypothetical protein
MGKREQTASMWSSDQKNAFERLARDKFAEMPSRLARKILVQFMACFIEEAEFMALGLGVPECGTLQYAVHNFRRGGATPRTT